ncbi:outer membrane protein assembly factor BamE [Rubellimicrobium roseum]|uniref:Outer membrane protein assembly factor BamE n=1 Tax=Rubellimicrobium roseum TaxID=687525 RepID=A0A5C4NDN0_9RHOB|nr:outer membrane protein assembly factor BamE [Rubellimicrobium roseum]TNC71428.1 outer membrane protein assembly factor BamE [Rubellimicrobium roseum]
MRRGSAWAVVVMLGLGACAPLVQNHGYVPPESALAGLQVGVDTRDEVIAAVGRPTTTGLVNDATLYYVQSRFERLGYRAPEEVDRQVLAISFLPDGRLGNIERFGLEQGRVVPLTRRTTAEVFADRTFINQLLGNVGRFDAGTLLGGDDAE